MAKDIQNQRIQEAIAVLKEDPDFKKLCSLVPSKLKGKTFGEDVGEITTDPEYEKRKPGKKDIVTLTEEEWNKYEQLDRACDRLAERYHLCSDIVMALACGGKPLLRPAPDQAIRATLDPVVFKPRDFDPKKRYIGYLCPALPVAAVQIMNRLPEDMDDQTKMEINASLRRMIKDIPGCRILELQEARPDDSTAQPPLRIDVTMRIPPGVSGEEVKRIYLKCDASRRQALTALGHPVKRRRVSKVLLQAETLRVFEDRLDRNTIYEIMDDVYGEAMDFSQDQVRRRGLILKRHKAKKAAQRKFPKHKARNGKAEG